MGYYYDEASRDIVRGQDIRACLDRLSVPNQRVKVYHQADVVQRCLLANWSFPEIESDFFYSHFDSFSDNDLFDLISQAQKWHCQRVYEKLYCRGLHGLMQVSRVAGGGFGAQSIANRYAEEMYGHWEKTDWARLIVQDITQMIRPYLVDRVTIIDDYK